MPEKEIKKNRFDLLDIIKSIVITLIIVIPIRVYIAQPFIVSGESMFPTFENAQYLIIDQLTYRFSEPQRGDVVVFKFPEDTSKFFIKRLIGLPGETVRVEKGEVYITEKDSTEKIKLDEPYIKLDRDITEETTLKENEYFVMGDNRLQSYDSRFWGPLEEKYLTGRVLLRLFPVDKIGYLPGHWTFTQ